MAFSGIVSVEDILSSPDKYERILLLLVYPSRDVELAISRLEALQSIGVDRIILWGDTEVYGVKILGKGGSSLVLLVSYRGEPTVAKILRTDVGDKDLSKEARILRYIVEKIGEYKVSPRLVESLDWLILMEYIVGFKMGEFLSSQLYLLDRDELLRFLRLLFTKAYLLDSIGVDHGELSRPQDHVIIRSDDYDPVFIDFEYASMTRKPHNFTSVAQAVLVRSPASDYILDLLGMDRAGVISLLRKYSLGMSRHDFEDLLGKLLRFSPE